MEEQEYILEIDLEKYINEKNKLYKIELNIFDLQKEKNNKIAIFNNNIVLKDKKNIITKLVLKTDIKYKLLLKIISRGNIDKIEQVIFNTKEDCITDHIKIRKNQIEISHNPSANWRKEQGRTSIYNNGQLIFLKGLLQAVWLKCENVITIDKLKQIIKDYQPEYIDEAVKILIEKGVLVKYEE